MRVTVLVVGAVTMLPVWVLGYLSLEAAGMSRDINGGEVGDGGVAGVLIFLAAFCWTAATLTAVVKPLASAGAWAGAAVLCLIASAWSGIVVAVPGVFGLILAALSVIGSHELTLEEEAKYLATDIAKVAEYQAMLAGDLRRVIVVTGASASEQGRR